MFLKILGDDDCPREYWPFVLRMETVLYGILVGGAPRIALLGEEERIHCLFEALGAAMDTRQKGMDPHWWPRPAPPLAWFDDYIHRHQKALGQEAARLAALTEQQRGEAAQEAFDREKIRRLAHESPELRRWLLPQETEHEPHRHTDGDQARNHHHHE
ncbi:MAG: hypothetical protein IIZ25_01540 [Thermoguttaceae bacterium]|nr:hypothetical protein [Thermoguttaceae bacterium]